MEKRDRIIELLTAVRYTTNDIEKVADEICLLFDVVGQSELLLAFCKENHGRFNFKRAEEAQPLIDAFLSKQ